MRMIFRNSTESALPSQHAASTWIATCGGRFTLVKQVVWIMGEWAPFESGGVGTILSGDFAWESIDCW